MVRILRVLALLCVVALPSAFVACGSNSPATSPTPTPAPAPTPAPTPTPAPAPTTAGLQGTVANSAGLPVSGARVAAIDGPNNGQAVTTNANGSYRFDSLAIANTNFSATASGYLEDRRGIFVDGTANLNFVLSPVPAPAPAPAPPPAPTISITARLISGGGGSATQEWGFNATGTVAFTSYDWDFGDGATATATQADEQHVYRSKGTFTVTVTGRRSSGDPVIGKLDVVVQ
jgi:PKD repeat protein